jgi:uncharacterized protein (DUF433 family)
MVRTKAKPRAVKYPTPKKTRRAVKESLAPYTTVSRLIIETDHPHIIRIDGVRDGEPITRKSHVSVRIIVGAIRLGETPRQLREAYSPQLSYAEISDALSYYLRHTAEIETYFAEHQAASERMLKAAQSRAASKHE